MNLLLCATALAHISVIFCSGLVLVISDKSRDENGPIRDLVALKQILLPDISEQVNPVKTDFSDYDDTFLHFLRNVGAGKAKRTVVDNNWSKKSVREITGRSCRFKLCGNLMGASQWGRFSRQ